MDHTKAYFRNVDDIAWQTASGSVYTGEAGTTSTVFPVAQAIAAGGTGLTIAKLLAAREIINDADQDDETAPTVLCVTANQITDLLNTTQITSADYNTVKALAAGAVDTFMGFKFLSVNGKRIDGTALVPMSTDTNRRCFAFQGDGLLLAVGQDVVTKISERADKNYATQVFLSMAIGATRMEEARAIEIPCSE
jgi:hypothetical protein